MKMSNERLDWERDNKIYGNGFNEEELQFWIARRKKCCAHKSKKDYNRQKEKLKEKNQNE